MNHSARYPYLNCIDGIEQQTSKISVKWINRFKQWVWVGQALPKCIILGMFKSEGLEEPMKYGCLRVRAFFHKTVRVCHVYCNFKIGFTCWITVIFGTLKDGSLLINTLASNICFSYRNMFQNGVDALSKIIDAFLSKRSKFHLVRIIR